MEFQKYSKDYSRHELLYTLEEHMKQMEDQSEKFENRKRSLPQGNSAYMTHTMVIMTIL